MATKRPKSPRPRIDVTSVRAMYQLGRRLRRDHDSRYGQKTLESLAQEWGTNVVLLRRARLFADRCTPREVKQFVQLGLTWTLVRVLIAVPDARKRMALARSATNSDRLVTAEQLSEMVGPHAGQQNKGRPSVELRRVRRLSRDLTIACRKCHLAKLDINRHEEEIRSTRTAVQDAREQLQVLDEALADSVRR